MPYLYSWFSAVIKSDDRFGNIFDIKLWINFSIPKSDTKSAIKFDMSIKRTTSLSMCSKYPNSIHEKTKH